MDFYNRINYKLLQFIWEAAFQSLRLDGEEEEYPVLPCPSCALTSH